MKTEHHSVPLCFILSPVGNLGYGFDEFLTASHLARLVPTGVPTAIILDSGSTDSGPSKLALGSTTCPRSSYVKDLTKLLKLVHTFRVPLIFTSAGGDGTSEHVKLMEEIVESITLENENELSGYSFKTITTFSDIDKQLVSERLQNGRIIGCGSCVPTLTEKLIEQSVRIVAQAGPEPILEAMETYPDFDILIGGRAYDPAPYAAYCAFRLRQENPGTTALEMEAKMGCFLHMGKIMECGGICATPKSHGAIATIYSTGAFDIAPMAPESICTPLTVAAHTLYENTRPDLLRGPGGSIDLGKCTYEQLEDGRTVRVQGSVFKSSKSNGAPYQIKLEAARVIGYRTIFMGSVRDAILVNAIDNLLPRIRAYVAQQHPNERGTWDLGFHIYGKNHQNSEGPAEIFIVTEALADTQQLATSIASKARIAMIHGPYPGQKATSGNFAFGLGGLMEIEIGPCAQFSIYHLMDLDTGEEGLQTSENLHHQGSRPLFSAVCKTIGSGSRVAVDGGFLSRIAALQDVYKIPAANMSQLTARVNSAHGPTPNPKTLSDVASVLRSKNAGPYEITIDIVFSSPSYYNLVKRLNILTAEQLAKVLNISPEDIIWMGFFEPALAFKVSIPRYRAGKKVSSGSFMENDVHGSQQHADVAKIRITQESPLAWISRVWSVRGVNVLTIVATLFAVGMIRARQIQVFKP